MAKKTIKKKIGPKKNSPLSRRTKSSGSSKAAGTGAKKRGRTATGRKCKGRPGNSGEGPSSPGSALVTAGPLIEPIYVQAEPGESIELGTIPATFAHAEVSSPREASVCMRFTPDVRLCFTFQTGHSNLLQYFRDAGVFGKNDGDLTLTDRGVKFNAFCVSRKPGSNKTTMVFVPKKSVVTATKPSRSLDEAVFHLFNFPDFLGPTDYVIETCVGNQSTQRRCGRVVLKAEGWTVTIAGFDKTADASKQLKEQGGFIITHMGKIQRDDDSPFSSKSLEDVLNCVHSFISLALGRWSGVALAIGFDKDGNRAFEQWGMPKAASGSWNGSFSWFDAHHSGLLSDLFPAFYSRWKDDLWGPVIRTAIYWYVAANDRGTGIGVDAGLILAQTALENLAWTYCVQDRKMVSPRAFEPRGLSTADRLRLLATALEIPTELPRNFRALRAKRGSKWNDSADAITGIRNALVHPAKKSEFAEGSYCEAWMLSLWYLDLVFLRLLGHDGEYANRLSQRWVGEVETVPWGKGADASTANE